MKEYVCERCGLKTKQRFNMGEHLQRKTLCKPHLADIPKNELLSKFEASASTKEVDESLTTHMCCFCERAHKTRQALSQHRKRCPKRPNAENKGDIEGLKEMIKSLQEQVQRLNGSTTNNTISNNTTNNIGTNIGTQNVIVINNLGKESIDHLQPGFLTNCILNMNNGIMDLFKTIHFNEDVPENMNIKIKSTKQNLLEVYQDGAWTPVDKNNTLDSVIQHKKDIMFSHFVKTKDEIDDIKDREETIMKWFAQMGSKMGTQFYRLRRDLYAIVVANNGEPILLQVVSE